MQDCRRNYCSSVSAAEEDSTAAIRRSNLLFIISSCFIISAFRPVAGVANALREENSLRGNRSPARPADSVSPVRTKQFLQKTGLPETGRNGTSQVALHELHVALCSVTGLSLERLSPQLFFTNGFLAPRSPPKLGRELVLPKFLPPFFTYAVIEKRSVH